MPNEVCCTLCMFSTRLDGKIDLTTSRNHMKCPKCKCYTLVRVYGDFWDHFEDTIPKWNHCNDCFMVFSRSGLEFDMIGDYRTTTSLLRRFHESCSQHYPHHPLPSHGYQPPSYQKLKQLREMYAKSLPFEFKNASKLKKVVKVTI